MMQRLIFGIGSVFVIAKLRILHAEHEDHDLVNEVEDVAHEKWSARYHLVVKVGMADSKLQINAIRLQERIPHHAYTPPPAAMTCVVEAANCGGCAWKEKHNP